jgi:ABC-type nitrate/sulfonate/bicarbonate transport system permease component
VTTHAVPLGTSGLPIVRRILPTAEASRIRTARLARRIAMFAGPIALLLFWELTVDAGLLDPRFFPAPHAIVSTFAAMLSAPWADSLQNQVLISLGRAFVGFVLGAIPGVVIGVIMGLLPLVRAALQPVIGAIMPIPKVAILPLVMLVFGLGESSKWAIIAIGVFFQVLVATSAGVASIERIYLDAAHNFGAKRWAVFATVAIPGAMPMILAGLRLGWATALLLLVTAEMVSSQSGIGFVIWRSWQTLNVEDMYVGLVAIAAIGIASFWLIDALEARLVPWRNAR